jgi:hypothetical protein
MIEPQSASASLPRPLMRVLGSVVLGAVVGWLLLAPDAPAAPVSAGALTPEVIAARTAVGLPSVPVNGAVRAAAIAVLGKGDPLSIFASSGGKGTLVTTSVPTGGALSTAQMEAVVFDPRVTALDVEGQGQSVAVAAALDPSKSFTSPVLTGAVVDPGIAGSLAVLFPPHGGTIPQITLQGTRGGQLVTIGIVATGVPAVLGAILVQLKGLDRITGPQIGYGLTYTLKIGNEHSFTVKTRPIPSVLLSHTFVAGPGFTGPDRQQFLKTVSSLPPEGRKIVDTIQGAVTVSVLGNSKPACGGVQTSCAGFDPGRGYYLVLNRGQLHSQVGKFVITHELGHLVDFLGLDTFSHEAFTSLFSKSPGYKTCYPLNGACSPSVEVFADQFGFFSTNAKGVQSGYGDPRLATGPAMASLLQVQWAFRPPQNVNPLAGFGPLAKSFEQALHTGANEL